MSADPENPHNQTQVNYQNSTLHRTVLGPFRVLGGSIRLSSRILSDMAFRLRTRCISLHPLSLLPWFFTIMRVSLGMLPVTGCHAHVELVETE